MICTCKLCGQLIQGPDPDPAQPDGLSWGWANTCMLAGRHFAEAHPKKFSSLQQAGNQLAAMLTANLVSLQILHNFLSTDEAFRNALAEALRNTRQFVEQALSIDVMPTESLVIPS